MVTINFTNNGSDEALMKSLHKQGLVQKEVQVHSRYGSHSRMQWVKASGDVKEVKSGKPKKAEYTPKSARSVLNEKKSDKGILYMPLSDCGNSTGKVLTHSDIITQYAKEKPHCSLKEWTKKNFFISDGSTDTEHMYKRGGKYTPERQKLHDQIIKNIVDQGNSPEPGKKPVAVLMGGGSACGKGTMRKNVVVPNASKEGITFSEDDCDDILGQLPEYEMFKQQDVNTAAFRAHEESMDIAMAALDKLVENNKNLLFDGTMKNLPKYTGIIDKLKKAGYEIQIVGMDLDPDEAFKRANARGAKSGRFIKEGIVRGSNGGFAATYPQLIDKVDKFSLFDNNGEAPRLIQDETGVKDQEAYDKFVNKGVTHTVNTRLNKLASRYDVDRSELDDAYNQGVSVDEIESLLKEGVWDMKED